MISSEAALFHTNTKTHTRVHTNAEIRAEMITDSQLRGEGLVLQGPYPGMSVFTGTGTLWLAAAPAVLN